MLFLAIAFAMMIWGQMVLGGHLSGITFALYWSACFALSLAAVVMGFLDVRDILRHLKAERAARLRQTFRQIKRPDKVADGSGVNQ